MRRNKITVGLIMLVAVLFLSAAIGQSAQLAGTIRVLLSAYYGPAAKSVEGKSCGELPRIAKDYENLHPGVKVKVVKMPELGAGEMVQWIVTQCTGGIAPEIMKVKNAWGYQFRENNWFIDFLPYLQEPNPYVEGNQKWWNQFIPQTTNYKIQADGKLYALPIDLTATAICYNKEIFKEVGVEPNPLIWKEWMEDHKKIQAAGYIPMIIDISSVPKFGDHREWIFASLIDGTCRDIIDNKLDVLRADGFVDSEEVCRGVKKGIYNLTEPQQHDWLRITKEWAKFWQLGFASPGEHERLWRTGKAAMIWQGVNVLVEYKFDPLRKFEYGTFWLPRITKETSQWGTGKQMRPIGGATCTEIAITNSAMKAGTVDVCIDFLRFLTKPENLEPMIKERASFGSNVFGVEASSMIEPMFKPFALEGQGEHLISLEFMDRQGGELWLRMEQRYFTGNITLTECYVRMQQALEEAVVRMMRKEAFDTTKW